MINFPQTQRMYILLLFGCSTNVDLNGLCGGGIYFFYILSDILFILLVQSTNIVIICLFLLQLSVFASHTFSDLLLDAYILKITGLLVWHSYYIMIFSVSRNLPCSYVYFIWYKYNCSCFPFIKCLHKNVFIYFLKHPVNLKWFSYIQNRMLFNLYCQSMLSLVITHHPKLQQPLIFWSVYYIFSIFVYIWKLFFIKIKAIKRKNIISTLKTYFIRACTLDE